MSESHITEPDAGAAAPGGAEADPWSSAREAARADVQAALRPRAPRTCPACGHVETGPGRTCSSCGGDFVVRRKRGIDRRLVAAGVAVLAVLGGTAAAVVPGWRSDAAEQQRAAAAAQRELEAAEKARLLREQRPVRRQGPRRVAGESVLVHRARLLAAAQTDITADARARMRSGEIDGPVKGTECAPYPISAKRSEQEADPSVRTNRYECLAFERRFSLPELKGQARTGGIGVLYWLVLDYPSARMTFCKITPRVGEGGRSLATVTAPRPCQDPLA